VAACLNRNKGANHAYRIERPLLGGQSARGSRRPPCLSVRAQILWRKFAACKFREGHEKKLIAADSF
jgi:hypothetical protein